MSDSQQVWYCHVFILSPWIWGWTSKKRLYRSFPCFQDLSSGQIVLSTRFLSMKTSKTNVSFLSFLSPWSITHCSDIVNVLSGIWKTIGTSFGTAFISNVPFQSRCHTVQNFKCVFFFLLAQGKFDSRHLQRSWYAFFAVHKITNLSKFLFKLCKTYCKIQLHCWTRGNYNK